MSFQISGSVLTACVAGVWQGVGSPPDCLGISTDTRTLKPGNLFVPLVGEHFDGHDYAALALERGAALVLAHKPLAVPHLRVKDTLLAYQALARWWRDQFSLPIIAITGSVGKTTTKELIAHVLGDGVLKTEANENNDIGVARTLLRLEPYHRYLVLEMAMRGPGEILRLAQMARPTLGVITKIGTAHIGRLGSQAAIARAKCELLQALDPTTGVAMLNGEDALLLATASQVWTGRTLKFQLEEVSETTLSYQGRSFQLPLAGRHNALNFLAALQVAEVLGLPLSERQALPPLVLPGSRTQVFSLAGVTMLDDTYNAAPEAMLAAVDWLAGRPGRRLAVLGAMGELGDYAQELHQKVGARVSQRQLDALFLVGSGAEITALAQAAEPVPTQVYPTLDALAQALARELQPGDQVLFKAARAVELERVYPLLQKLFEEKGLPEEPGAC